jgi:hypothetical protein
MLFMFESTMAKSRLKTLTELRRVRVDGQTVMVYRCGKYVILMSIKLVPYKKMSWFLNFYFLFSNFFNSCLSVYVRIFFF